MFLLLQAQQSSASKKRTTHAKSINPTKPSKQCKFESHAPLNHHLPYIHVTHNFLHASTDHFSQHPTTIRCYKQEPQYLQIHPLKRTRIPDPT